MTRNASFGKVAILGFVYKLIKLLIVLLPGLLVDLMPDLVLDLVQAMLDSSVRRDKLTLLL
jgi:hypothetical protein